MKQSKFFNDTSLIREAINNDRLVVFAGVIFPKNRNI